MIVASGIAMQFGARPPGAAATVVDFQGSYEDYLESAGAEMATA